MNSERIFQDITRLAEGSPVPFAEWTRDEAVPWVRREMEGIYAKAFPVVPDHEAIRAGLTITLMDLLELPKKASFWGAQLVMFESETSRYVNAGLNCHSTSTAPFKNTAEWEVNEGLRRHLRDAVIMLESAGTIRLDLEGAYGAWAVGEYHTFPMYKAAEQLAYGRYSGLTHTDEAEHASSAILRTAIELRIRRAFGIQSYLNQNTGELTPISLSGIMKKVLEQAKHIHCPVDLHDVNRIYRWSNPYLHAGRKSYAWQAGFCLQHLRPLFVGPNKLKSRSGFSMDGGLEMPRVVWERIRRPFTKTKQGIVLFPTNPKPECILYEGSFIKGNVKQ